MQRQKSWNDRLESCKNNVNLQQQQQQQRPDRLKLRRSSCPDIDEELPGYKANKKQPSKNTPLRRLSINSNLMSRQMASDGGGATKLSPGRSSNNLSNLPPPLRSTARRGSLPCFDKVGLKMTGLIRATNAFKRSKKTTSAGDESLGEEAYVIQKLPTYPCFASTLSTEAQYAMLMGYEDVVYSRLATTYPTHRGTLRRNSTPCSAMEVTNEIPFKQEMGVQNVTPLIPTLVVTSETTVFTDVDLKSTSEGDNNRDNKIRVVEDSKAIQQPRPMSRSQSLPQLVVPMKQLVMTYRYQKAMDIYDALRTHEGVNSLSPRIIKGQRNNDRPIQDFNSWTMVWSREFKPKTDRNASV